MSDLRCTRCGIEASYADANIADLRETCEETRRVELHAVHSDEPSGKMTVTVPTDHNWVEVDA